VAAGVTTGKLTAGEWEHYTRCKRWPCDSCQEYARRLDVAAIEQAAEQAAEHGCACRLGPDCPRPGSCDDSAIAAGQAQLLNACPWCDGYDFEPHDPESALCRSHLAEYEGLSLGELERMERAQDGEARVSASDGHSDADPGL